MLLLFFYQITEGAEMNKKHLTNQNHYYFKDFLPLLTQNDLKLLKNGQNSLKIAVKLELWHLLTK